MGFKSAEYLKYEYLQIIDHISLPSINLVSSSYGLTIYLSTSWVHLAAPSLKAMMSLRWSTNMLTIILSSKKTIKQRPHPHLPSLYRCFSVCSQTWFASWRWTRNAAVLPRPRSWWLLPLVVCLNLDSHSPRPGSWLPVFLQSTCDKTKPAHSQSLLIPSLLTPPSNQGRYHQPACCKHLIYTRKPFQHINKRWRFIQAKVSLCSFRFTQKGVLVACWVG